MENPYAPPKSDAETKQGASRRPYGVDIFSLGLGALCLVGGVLLLKVGATDLIKEAPTFHPQVHATAFVSGFMSIATGTAFAAMSRYLESLRKRLIQLAGVTLALAAIGFIATIVFLR